MNEHSFFKTAIKLLRGNRAPNNVDSSVYVTIDEDKWQIKPITSNNKDSFRQGCNLYIEGRLVNKEDSFDVHKVCYICDNAWSTDIDNLNELLDLKEDTNINFNVHSIKVFSRGKM